MRYFLLRYGRWRQVNRLGISIPGNSAIAIIASLDEGWMEETAKMTIASIARTSLDKIIAQAEREYPFECCGFVIGDAAMEEVRPIMNIQQKKHEQDPAAFPRDARTAFLMDPREHLAVMKEIDGRRLELKVVYHSHPDHDAYFSATDRAQACSFDADEPDYPGVIYIVVSVRGAKFARAAAFAWDPDSKEFVETELVVR